MAEIAQLFERDPIVQVTEPENERGIRKITQNLGTPSPSLPLSPSFRVMLNRHMMGLVMSSPLLCLFRTVLCLRRCDLCGLSWR